MKNIIFIFISIFFLVLFLSNDSMSQDKKCNNCDGTGKLTCISCNGSKTINCNICGGKTGWYEKCTMSNCNDGYITLPNGDKEKCTNCNEKGKVWHTCYNPSCNNGKVTCTFCQGTGTKKCPVCKGTGKTK